MKITDNKRTVEIRMGEWDNGPHTECAEELLTNRGYDDERDVYIVDDVESCIAYAREWEQYGDNGDDEENADSRYLIIDEIAA